MNILFWWIVAVLVVCVLPVVIIIPISYICGIYDELFNKKYKQREKIREEFRKKFANCNWRYSEIANLKDMHYRKHHMDSNFENLLFTEFAVRYIDPKTMNYNEKYRLDWNK